MRKTIFKWLILICLMAYITGITIWAHGEAERHSCRDIRVAIAGDTRADSVTANGVLAELHKYPGRIKGAPLSALDTRGIEQFLSSYSNFESVDCAVTTDGILDINVVPMVPAIRVFDGDRSYYINKDGKVIESKANFFVDVPVVVGHFNKEFQPRQVLPLIRFIQSDPTLDKLVAMVEARDAENLILVPRIQGHVVNFGDTTRLDEKRRALMTIYHKVIPYKGWSEYDTISVKFKGQVVATRSNKALVDHGGVYDDDIDMEEATLPDISPAGD